MTNDDVTDPQANWDGLKKTIKTAAINCVRLVANTKQQNRSPDTYTYK